MLLQHGHVGADGRERGAQLVPGVLDELLLLFARLVQSAQHAVERRGEASGLEIDVGEDHAADSLLLEDLRAPARGIAGVEQLAALEAQGLEHPDAAVEPLAGTVVGVVVLVGPANAVGILARLL